MEGGRGRRDGRVEGGRGVEEMGEWRGGGRGRRGGRVEGGRGGERGGEG